MAFGGVVLTSHVPTRTCTGCRATAPQRELVRLVVHGARLVVDPSSRPHSVPRSVRLAGRGAYVHADEACVTAQGLSRSLRRRVTPAEVSRLVAEMSPSHDNLRTGRLDQPRQNASQNAPGLEGGDTVEMPPQSQAKGDRSEDARL